MSKTKGVAYWDKKLWTEFSKFIRQRDADHAGYATCFTCDVVKPWQEMDAGHFVSRNAKAIKYDEQNVHAQCKSCNGFHGGMAYEYGKRLDEKYGKGTAENLEAQRFSIIKRTPDELEALYKHYKELNTSGGSPTN